ncbi:flagellar hook-length control protein FliK [Phenylobacterium sp.]|uniref:flagellar hook-length control protein FliK n=1 Tax=Phenylobacterium sp. TaxID=1871053 RepID=UPI002F95AC03
MTASVPTVSAIAAPGQAPASGGAAQPAVGGFDLLMAAFSGQGEAAAGDPALAGLMQAAGLATLPAGDAVAAPADGEEAPASEFAEAAPAQVDPEAALALLAVMTIAAPEPQAPVAATVATSVEPEAPPAWGRDKAPGAPAAPALAHADPEAGLEAEATEPAGQDATAHEPGRSAEAHAPREGGLGPRTSAPAPTAAAANTTAPANPAAPATTAAPPPVGAAPAPPVQPQAQPQTQPQTQPQPATPPVTAAAAPEAVEAAAVAVAAPPAPREKTPARSERAQSADTPTARVDAASGGAPAPRVGGAQTLVTAEPARAEPAGVEAAALEAATVEPEAEAPDAQGPAQAASTASSSAPAAAAAHTPVRGSPETVAAMAAQIIKKLDARSTRFDLELHPADLGRVDVRIEINHQGRVSAAMAFDNPQAAAELKGRAGELQKALEQAGFDLSGGMSFDVAGDQGRGQQHLADQWADREPAPGFRGKAFEAALATAGEADTGAASALNLRRGLRSGVDVRI